MLLLLLVVRGAQSKGLFAGLQPPVTLVQVEAGAAIVPWTYVPPFAIPSTAIYDVSGHTISMSCLPALEELAGSPPWEGVQCCETAANGPRKVLSLNDAARVTWCDLQ